MCHSYSIYKPCSFWNHRSSIFVKCIFGTPYLFSASLVALRNRGGGLQISLSSCIVCMLCACALYSPTWVWHSHVDLKLGFKNAIISIRRDKCLKLLSYTYCFIYSYYLTSSSLYFIISSAQVVQQGDPSWSFVALPRYISFECYDLLMGSAV